MEIITAVPMWKPIHLILLSSSLEMQEYLIPSDASIGKLKLNELTIAVYGKTFGCGQVPVIRSGSRHTKQQHHYPGAEVGQLPSARTIGMQLNLKF